jgi:hypothetical protein
MIPFFDLALLTMEDATARGARAIVDRDVPWKMLYDARKLKPDGAFMLVHVILCIENGQLMHWTDVVDISKQEMKSV